jgi:hypothetical protein
MMRLRTFWDQDRIIKEIRAMRDQNLPLYPHYVMKNHRNLSRVRYGTLELGARRFVLRA